MYYYYYGFFCVCSKKENVQLIPTAKKSPPNSLSMTMLVFVNTHSEYVGNRHGGVREAMHEDGLQQPLREVECPARGSNSTTKNNTLFQMQTMP